MKKQKIIKKIIVIIIMLNIIAFGKAYASDIQVVQPEYTKEYNDYINLSEEEKENAIVPRKYNISGKESTNEAILQNENVPFGKLITLAQASAYSNEKTFSLKNYIPNNLKIKNQENTHLCWAFSALSSLETNLAMKNYLNKNTEKLYDYSERHMGYCETQSFKDGKIYKYGHNMKLKEGGSIQMAVAYLTNGQGAVAEEDMPFEDNEDEIDLNQIQNKKVLTTVNDVIYFDSIVDPKTADQSKLAKLQTQMKEQLATNGSIFVTTYMPSISGDDNLNVNTAAIYWAKKADDKATGHAYSIVGWDDNYSKDNFIKKPSIDGAWIIRNSYGEEIEVGTFDDLKEQIVKKYPDKYSSVDDITDEEFDAYVEKLKQNEILNIDEDNEKIYMKVGKNGFFYVSYEDYYIYSNMIGIVSADDEKKYDNIYQLDELGDLGVAYIKDSMNKDIYIANVFTRNTDKTEYLNSIGFNTRQSGTYEVYVNQTGKDKTITNLKKVELVEGNNITLTPGYHTIKFKKDYELTGSNFAVVVKMINKNGEYNYFSVEGIASKQMNDEAKSKKGESFMTIDGRTNDNEWEDIGDSNNTNNYLGNLCIKGITTLTSNSQEIEKANEETKNPENENQGTNDPEKENQETNNPGNEKTKATASKIENAKAILKEIKVDSSKGESYIELKIEGIDVTNENQQFEHYFYISSNSNETDLENKKWEKATSFEKQENGTYTLTMKISNFSYLSDLEQDDAYIYVKEIAKNGEDSVTNYWKSINIKTNPSDYDINQNGTETTIKQNQNNNNDNNDKNDNTTAQTVLPYTGSKIMFIVVVVVIFFGIIGLRKYLKLKDIK